MTSLTILGRVLLPVLFLVLFAVPDSWGQYRINSVLPPIPSLQGPLDINLVYPTVGMTRPAVEKNFIFGSVGTGTAKLTINGDSIPVAPNGAFLAYLPMPDNGIYALLAENGEERDTLVFTYATPQAAEGGSTRQVLDLIETPKRGVVTGGVDTLATGSEIAYGAPTPTADRIWNFPKGTEFPVYERRGNHLRVDLAGDTAWVEEKYVTVSSDEPESAEAGIVLTMDEGDRWVDVTIPVHFTPFKVDSRKKEIELTFYNALAFELEKSLEKEKGRSVYSVTNTPNSLIAGYRWQADTGREVLHLTVDLRRPFWGFKAFYNEEGGLVLRVRRPKAIDPEKPLRGLRIMVDAGHPPRGADGPTGLSEAEANLAIALKLEEKLKREGAAVLMTRRDGAAIASESDPNIELAARVSLAVEKNADLLISVHNNGFSDGADPFKRNGTETYYFHPFAAELARTLHEEILKVTGVPSLGYKQRSLALTRPTWMPAVLTESLYMMHPQQEAALRNPEFIDRLAEAHLRGILRFVEMQNGK